MVTVMRARRRRASTGRLWVAVVAAGLAGLFGPVSSPLAQTFRSPPAAPPSGPAEGRRMIDTIRIWKMTEALQLSEDQAIKLFPRLTQLEASRREFHRRQRGLRVELGELLRQRPTREVDIKRILEELDRIDFDFRSRERAVRGELQSILSLEQQARLTLFEEGFEMEMRRTIHDLRRRRQGLAPGPDPGIVRPGVRRGPPLPVESGPPER